MAYKSEIKKQLSDRLSSNTWQSLKTALIGRELIAWGAEVLNSFEIIKASILDSLYPSRAELKDLISAAQSQELSLDFVKPHTVKIRIPSGMDTIVAPYALQIQVGSTMFTNHQFVNLSDDIVLYQGIPKKTFSVDGTADLITLQVVDTVTWEQYSEYTTSENFSRYIKLPRTTLSDSVRVIVKGDTEGVFPYSEYTPLRHDPQANLYKVRPDWDERTQVIFGNGIWGTTIENSSRVYEVIFLDLTNIVIEVKNQKLQVNGTNYDYTVLSQEEGGDLGVAYVREYFQAQLTKTTVAGTIPQIENFVRNFPTVVDCAAVATQETNTVTIYVKPTNLNDTNFSGIVDALYNYAEALTTYKAVRGEPFYFDVYLRSLETSVQLYRTDAQAAIEAELAYDKLPYRANISTLRLSDIAATYGVRAAVRLVVTETVTTILSLTPYKGTFKILNRVNDQWVEWGWDSDGIIYLRTSATQNFGLPIYGIGQFLFLKDGAVLKAFATFNEILTDATTALKPVLTSDTLDKGEGYFATYNQDQDNMDWWIQYFSINSSFKNTDTSIQKLQNTPVLPTHTSKFQKSTNSKYVPRVSNGAYELHEVKFDTNQFVYKRYDSVFNTGDGYYHMTAQPALSFYADGSTSISDLVLLADIQGTLMAFTKKSYFFPITGANTTKPLSELSQGFDWTKVVKAIYDNNRIIWLVNDGGYKVYMSFAPQLDDTGTSINFDTAAIQLFTGVTLVGDDTSIELLLVDEKVWVKDSANIYAQAPTSSAPVESYNAQTQVGKIDQVGTLDYNNKQLNVPASLVVGMNMQYETTSTSITPDVTKYPVLRTVVWE